MKRAFSIIVLPWVIRAGDDETSVTRALNDMMRASNDISCVYCGGKGVVVRNPFDDYQDDVGKNVVPATFWVNDIKVPSQIYPDIDYPETPEDAAYRASVAFVIGTNLGSLLYDIDHIQDADWGWGVFYATDSNAADARCRWLESYNFFDCPGGGFYGNDWNTFVPESGSDPHLGAGWYGWGNPYAISGGGGGTGNHFNGDAFVMDQEQGDDGNGVSLLRNWDAECNYDLMGNWWGDWVTHWFTYGNRYTGVDPAICWVNNPRDMIMMQNIIYANKDSQSGPGFPKPGTPAAMNWGWNEIPLDRQTLGDPMNWDAVMIHLPAEICSSGGAEDYAQCLVSDVQWRLEQTFDKWVNAGYLVPGMDNLANRPGSYVVWVREIQENGDWYRWFFCSWWTSPSGKYEIVSYPAGGPNGDGACAITWGSSLGSAPGSNVTQSTSSQKMAVV